MFFALQNYIAELPSHFSEIPKERMEKLSEVADYIRWKLYTSKQAKLVFICTHNSRRSHFAQIWTSIAAHYMSIPSIETYSGGTQATAFNPRAVETLKSTGFLIDEPNEENPKYTLKFDHTSQPFSCFSKLFDDPVNPQKNFAAIMTCSDADINCPLVPGAELRVPITYQDPKEWDETPQEKAIYKERCQQIATEMFYMVRQVQETDHPRQM